MSELDACFHLVAASLIAEATEDRANDGRHKTAHCNVETMICVGRDLHNKRRKKDSCIIADMSFLHTTTTTFLESTQALKSITDLGSNPIDVV